MEFHLVGIQEPAGILPDVEAGIEIRLFLEKRKVQDADTDALLEYIIFLPLFNLVGVHLSGIEEGAIRPYQQLRELDFHVNHGIVVHEDADVKDPQLVILMYFPEVRVQDPGFLHIFGIQVEHGGQEADACFLVHHDFLEGKINLRFH